MDVLYAPWRSRYVTKTVRSRKKKGTDDECVFCVQFDDPDDKKNFILKRFKYNAIMLNRHPYNAGHLLILPLNHTAQLYELDNKARTEMMNLTSKSTHILPRILECAGINIGLNLGKVAGAGLPGHLHMHLLPRWDGDTNWLPVLADTKQISVDLHQIYNELKPAFDKLNL